MNIGVPSNVLHYEKSDLKRFFQDFLVEIVDRKVIIILLGKNISYLLGFLYLFILRIYTCPPRGSYTCQGIPWGVSVQLRMHLSIFWI